ncbi:unnamed protein product [Prunus armeniaca]
MEGSRDLSLGQAVREPDCHGSIITSRNLEVLVFCDTHHEPAVQHDDANCSRHGCLVRPLSNWRGSEHHPHNPKGPSKFQGRLAYDGQACSSKGEEHAQLLQLLQLLLCGR